MRAMDGVQAPPDALKLVYKHNWLFPQSLSESEDFLGATEFSMPLTLWGNQSVVHFRYPGKVSLPCENWDPAPKGLD